MLERMIKKGEGMVLNLSNPIFHHFTIPLFQKG
jgi:hypothetical protein